MITFSFRRRIGASLALLAALGVAACSSSSATPTTEVAQTVTVIGLNNDTSRVLTAIYAKALTNGGFRVAHRDDVADIAAGIGALQSGAADFFVAGTNELLTYFATTNAAAAASTSTTTTTTIAPTTTIEETTTTEAPTTTSKATTTTSKATTTTSKTGSSSDTSTDATGDTTAGSDESTTSVEESTTTTISTAGQAAALSINGQTNEIGEILPTGLQIGAPSSAQEKQVIACVSSVLTGISNLTDLSRAASSLRIAGPASFEKGDPFGLVGFEKTFGATFEKFVTVDAGKVAQAMTPATPTPSTGETTTTTTDPSTSSTVVADDPSKRDADCGAFESLDASISSSMTILDDDKNWITTNGYLPVMNTPAYTPGVSQMIDRVSQALTTDTLRELLREVQADGLAPNVVADSWLQTVGITS